MMQAGYSWEDVYFEQLLVVKTMEMWDDDEIENINLA
jgi:hypothetical protein